MVETNIYLKWKDSTDPDKDKKMRKEILKKALEKRKKRVGY